MKLLLQEVLKVDMVPMALNLMENTMVNTMETKAR
jgi:hypothetical protein